MNFKIFSLSFPATVDCFLKKVCFKHEPTLARFLLYLETHTNVHINLKFVITDFVINTV